MEDFLRLHFLQIWFQLLLSCFILPLIGLGSILVRESHALPRKKSKQIFPEMKLRGFVPNFWIHVSVSDLYIPTSVCGPIVGIYKRSLCRWFRFAQLAKGKKSRP
jgi:hypothetical protein